MTRQGRKRNKNFQRVKRISLLFFNVMEGRGIEMVGGGVTKDESGKFAVKLSIHESEKSALHPVPAKFCGIRILSEYMDYPRFTAAGSEPGVYMDIIIA